MKFEEFPKISRYSRPVVITEKIDGTNGQIIILPYAHLEASDPEPVGISGEFMLYAGSRTRFITPENDNFGFAAWVRANADDLVKLGYGRHFGEWYGQGIQRNYGLKEKRFALFNVKKWGSAMYRPACCGVVPIIASGDLPGESNEFNIVDLSMRILKANGSYAVPGFMRPEGIVIYHTAANVLFKKTFENDEGGKGE